MYCSKCGKEVSDDALYCESCGYQHQNMSPAKLDKNSIGLNILSFFIPIVGLILYLVNRKASPLKAKGIGIWALVGFAAGIIFYNI